MDIKDIITLERIQRHPTKFILNDYCSDYKNRLIKLKLLPLMRFRPKKQFLALALLIVHHYIIADAQTGARVFNKHTGLSYFESRILYIGNPIFE